MTSGAVADPPKNKCNFKVYSCAPEAGAEYTVSVFDGHNSVHVFSASDVPDLQGGQYASMSCNHSNCDTTVLNFPTHRRWVHGQCKDIYITTSSANILGPMEVSHSACKFRKINGVMSSEFTKN